MDVSDEVNANIRLSYSTSLLSQTTSFMDRVSIGNARLYNMEVELNMGGDDYLLAVSVLFITYCVSRA